MILTGEGIGIQWKKRKECGSDPQVQVILSRTRVIYLRQCNLAVHGVPSHLPEILSSFHTHKTIFLQ